MTISTGTLRVGILAILAGLVGAFVIQQVLQDEPVAEKPVPQPRVIPQAAADLPAGRVLTMGDIVLVPMTPEQIRERDVPMNTVMADPSQIIGRRLREDLTQGSFFSTTSMYLEFGAPDLSKLLKPGYRAFSLSFPTSAARSFHEGMLVDVMFRTTPRKGTEDTLPIPEMTVTLLQSVEVVHIEYPPPKAPGEDNSRSFLDLRTRQGRPDSTPASTVTLAVTPEQAKIMRTAMGRGEITLSPYSAQDRFATADTQPLTLEDILGIEPPPPEPVVVPFFTEIYRRGGGSYNAFNRATIHPFSAPKPFKPGQLPAPNPLPAPMNNN